MNGVRIRTLAADDADAWRARLAAFERDFEYPLGDDRFRIDHGDDYLAFFRALGEPTLLLATVDDDIAGMLVAVRRRFCQRDAWYLCDFKVARRHGAARIGMQLLRRWAGDHLDRYQPAFGVSMDPPSGANRLVRTGLRCREADPLRWDQLWVFSLDHDAWCRAAPLLARERDVRGFYDPAGIKDIRLDSTGRAMPLLHVQHGPLARPNCDAARPGHVHMICMPADDALAFELARLHIVPQASATIAHRHMGNADWRQLLTSDI